MKKSRHAFGVIAALVVVVAAVALATWCFLGPGDRKVFFDGMFGSLVGGFITAIVTLGLIWVGLSQLEGLNDTTSEQARTTAADFILRPNRSILSAGNPTSAASDRRRLSDI